MLFSVRSWTFNVGHSTFEGEARLPPARLTFHSLLPSVRSWTFNVARSTFEDEGAASPGTFDVARGVGGREAGEYPHFQQAAHPSRPALRCARRREAMLAREALKRYN